MVTRNIRRSVWLMSLSCTRLALTAMAALLACATVVSTSVAAASGSMEATEEVPKASAPEAGQYRASLEKKVTVNVSESPGGGKLTIQYAVMAVCEAAGVPYQWQKSTELAGSKCRQFTKPLHVDNVEARIVIQQILSGTGLTFGVDANGLYLSSGPAKSAESMPPRQPPRTGTLEGTPRMDLGAGADAFRGQKNTNIAADDFSLRDLDGNKVQLADFKGSVLVIGHGMSWCAGCPPEGHELRRLRDQFQSRGVDFLYLNQGETPNTALDFAKYCGIKFPMLLCTSYRVPRTYQVGNPGVIVVDRDARVRMSGHFTEVGSGEQIIGAALKGILEEQPATGVKRSSAPKRTGPVKPSVQTDGWSEAELVSSEGTKSYQPSVAPSGRGGVWVAWTDNALGNGEIAVRQFDGQNWGDILHPVPSDLDDYSPRIATDKSGNAWLAWVSNRSGKYTIWVSRHDGRNWHAAVMVSDGKGDSFHPSIAVDGKGRIWVAWYAWSLKTVGGKEYLWRSIRAAYNDGNAWSTPVEITPFDDICVDHWDPEIAIDGTDMPVLCWAKDNRNDPTVFSSVYKEGSWTKDMIVSKTPKPEQVYADPTRPFDFAPRPASCLGGDVRLLWQTFSEGGWQIKCSLWSAGHWSAPEQLTNGQMQNCCPVAAARRDEGVVAFWARLKEPDGEWEIAYAELVGKWQEPRALVAGGNNLNPVCCVDGSGKLCVVWQSGDGGKWGIYATREK